jgi:hypothetical protein
MAHLYPQYLYKTQDFLARFVHSGNNIQCQREINKILKKFDISEFESDFRGTDSDFLTLYLRKLLEEFWKRPFLLERKKENSVDFQTQIIEREKVICKVIKTTYQILNPPDIQMKRLADMIYENIRAYFDTKLDVIDAESETEKSESEQSSAEEKSDAESGKSESEKSDSEKSEIDVKIDEEVTDEKPHESDKSSLKSIISTESILPVEEKKLPGLGKNNSGSDEKSHETNKNISESLPELIVSTDENIVDSEIGDKKEPEILGGENNILSEKEISPVSTPEQNSDIEEVSAPVEEKKDNINHESGKNRNIYFRRQFGDPNLFGGTPLL